MINLFDLVSVTEAQFSIFLNTNTFLDLAFGKFYQGKNNWLLNGGLSHVNGFVGRNGMYKSAKVDSIVANTMLMYPGSNTYSYDSEKTKPSKTRYDDYVDTPVSDRIKLFDGDEYDINGVHDIIKDLVNTKLKHAKDLEVETPFLTKDKKNIRMLIPTFFIIDSFSRARSNEEDELFTKFDLNDSKTNTADLADGKIKTHFMKQLIGYGKKAHIYFLLTAHVGGKKELTSMPWQQTPRQLQYMRSDDRIKNVGSQFEFLTSTCLQTTTVKAITDKDNECYYPTLFSTPTEVNELKTTVLRNKNNAAGMNIPFVFSQNQGILNDLTHFNYLREYAKDAGLNVKGNNYSSMFLPDISVNRKNVRAKLKDSYELCRALQLTAQLIYVQNYWTTFKQDIDTTIPVEEFINILMKNNKPSISDILNSRGYWSYCNKDARMYLTLFDVLQIIQNGKLEKK